MNYDKVKKELQEKHGKIFTIDVQMDDEGEKINVLFLKKASRQNHAMISNLAVGKDSTRAIEAALKALYVGGDSLDEVMNDEESLMGCETAIVEMLQKRQSILKKN